MRDRGKRDTHTHTHALQPTALIVVVMGGTSIILILFNNLAQWCSINSYLRFIKLPSRTGACLNRSFFVYFSVF